MRHDPQFAVERGTDILFGKILYINVCQPREARKDKYVAYLLQPHTRHLLLQDALQLFFGQIAAVYFLQPDAIVGERGVEYPAVVLCLDDNHAERLHEFDCRILTALLFRLQILLEAHDKGVRHFFQCNIFDLILR